jgi:pimeloyl-ACP methyl ester carboxylesterase
MFWLSRRQKLRSARSWIAVFCLLASTSCTSISVRHVARPDLIALGGLSPATQQIAGSRRPSEAVALTLLDVASIEPSPSKLLASAELAYQAGSVNRHRSPVDALRWYFACARQSYVLLSLPESDHDQTLRALQLYNGAVAHCLRLAIKTCRLDCRSQSLSIGLDETLSDAAIAIDLVGFYRTSTEFGKLELCEDLEVIGLPRMHSVSGMGVPVLIHRLQVADSPSRQLYEPKDVSFPATAIIHFDGPANVPTRLELANPLTVQSTKALEQPSELAADFTTPLASTVSKSPLERLALVGFLRSDSVRTNAGIRMLEPYQPGKIPVLFVHGLASSPITWVPMFNDLLADPALRQRYQFWSYFYPTGDPFPTSSADLRESLIQLRHDLDPNGTDQTLNQMVLVGHSMGGLLSRMMTVDSGNEVWRIVSEQPFDSVDLSPKVKDELRRTFFFERQSYIKRVIFIATPHHGSSLSPGLPGQLANRLVVLRNELTEANKEMTQKIPDLPGGHVPTSVELLAPNSLALRILNAQPRPADVHFHSIVGVETKITDLATRWLRESSKQTDGVVPYSSAHLESAESELIVSAEHSRIHQTVEASKEIRLILLEHLQSLDEPDASVSTTKGRSFLELPSEAIAE